MADKDGLGFFSYKSCVLPSAQPDQEEQYSLKIPDNLLIPTLVDGRKIPQSCRVVSGVYHLGDSPQSGHYRAFFHDFRAEHIGVNHRYMSEDGVRVAELSSKEAEVLLRNFYLLALVGE